MKTYNAIEFPIMDRDWQVKILNLIKEKPDDRSIYWFWKKMEIVVKPPLLNI